jgi:hypothetical protein
MRLAVLDFAIQNQAQIADPVGMEDMARSLSENTPKHKPT